MNLLHLKYAVEVEKTGSISQAADNLYMGQPNLSKAIKELETNLGIVIFKRTSKGAVPTKKGQEFLVYAKNILTQIDEMESLYLAERSNRISFAICIPRASYITYAFSCFVNKLPKDKDLLIDFKETNSINAINNVVNSDCNLAIVRYPLIYEDYFLQMIQDKHLQSEDIWQYEYIVLLSLEHPLALQETVDYNQLVQGIEILHGDSTTPYLSCGEIKRANQSQEHRNIIYVYERGSQFDFLQEVPGSYMWASPVPEIVLKHYGLVQRQCPLANYQYKDILIYNQGYKLSHLDKTFIEELLKIRNGLS